MQTHATNKEIVLRILKQYFIRYTNFTKSLLADYSG